MCLLLSCGLLLPTIALASEPLAGLTVQPLLVDAEPADVLSGSLDSALLAARASPSIERSYGRHGHSWWRISADRAVPADVAPKLVLHDPYLARVQAWVPGMESPSRHAMYGVDADYRHSSQMLVIDLPIGLPAGSVVWLRVDSTTSFPMGVSLQALDDVLRADLRWLVWRTSVLSVMLTLALLGVAFWLGTGEKSYGWFGVMLCFAVLYVVSIGGDFRSLPGADLIFGQSRRMQWLFAGFGVICSNLFQRSYLNLGARLPRMDRLLTIGSLMAMLMVVGALFTESRLMPLLGNLALMLSAITLLWASFILAWRGDRAGRFVVVSWLPLMVCALLVGGTMMGIWSVPTWMMQALLGSFAWAGLLLTMGLADRFLQLRRDRDQASARATTDTLTGVLNRTGVEDRLRKHIARAKDAKTALSIAFIDLDHFKQINDQHGHGVGDQCLRIIAQRASNQLDDGNLLGRFGGDEFVVVMPDADINAANRVAAAILQSVTIRPLTLDDRQLDCTLSIGVAQMQPRDSLEQLLHRADQALYASKAAGRNRVSCAFSSIPYPEPA